MEDEPTSPPPIGNSDSDPLANSEFLAREELLKRRSIRLKNLAKCYRSHYWALMEDLRIKYREYYWMYGKSPLKEDEEREMEGGNGANGGVDVVDECNFGENAGKLGLGLGFGDELNRCAFPGCKSKAMALSRYCHPHILSDSKQQLYKGCKYVIKSVQAGRLHCGKPILRSVIPSLCPNHLQKTEKDIARALKKSGLTVASATKFAPKFHLLLTEYVREIQTKRGAALKGSVDHMVMNETP